MRILILTLLVATSCAHRTNDLVSEAIPVDTRHMYADQVLHLAEQVRQYDRYLQINTYSPEQYKRVAEHFAWLQTRCKSQVEIYNSHAVGRQKVSSDICNP